MKMRGLLIAAGVLAVLSGMLYWSNHRKASEETAVKAAPDAPPKITSLNESDILRVTIRHPDQPELELARNDSGTWQIAAPKVLGADRDAVSSLLSTLSSLNSERLIEDKTSDPARFGLAKPQAELDVSLKNNNTQKLLIGDQTPTSNSCYVMLAGDPRVFTIAGYDKSNLDKTVVDLRDKRLLTADFDKVSQIELLGQQPKKTQDITFARSKEAWQILKPQAVRTDSAQVDDLIRAVGDAKMETSAGSEVTAGKKTGEDNNAALFKSATPFATVKITGASGMQQLELRKAKEDYYAKSSVVDGFWKVPANVGTSLDKSLDDFRNKKLFDFGFEDPNRLELRDAGKSYALTRSGTDWSAADGKKFDSAAVQAVIDHLRDLTADKFPASSQANFATPELEITVVSNDSKRTEKAAIAKSGASYIAKRENEPELYEIPAAAVTDLEKAAAQLAPAAPAKK